MSFWIHLYLLLAVVINNTSPSQGQRFQFTVHASVGGSVLFYFLFEVHFVKANQKFSHRSTATPAGVECNFFLYENYMHRLSLYSWELCRCSSAIDRYSFFAICNQMVLYTHRELLLALLYILLLSKLVVALWFFNSVYEQAVVLHWWSWEIPQMKIMAFNIKYASFV